MVNCEIIGGGGVLVGVVYIVHRYWLLLNSVIFQLQKLYIKLNMKKNKFQHSNQNTFFMWMKLWWEECKQFPKQTNKIKNNNNKIISFVLKVKIYFRFEEYQISYLFSDMWYTIFILLFFLAVYFFLHIITCMYHFFGIMVQSTYFLLICQIKVIRCCI